ncbi:hypothetical protein [Xenophilus sp. Marseille-Q4582]|uniref:hypothetical protein n=1 Tax=Xenophilus sp. Marseille-Q4582 TaxID=2866600 RepID=UPI001CE49DA5|nr:hypothetical protein [Xenophilus sp. Marseille-Q4582]
MNEADSQIHIPPAFLALYSDRRQRLTLPPAQVHQRHELCEDLAQMLVETARAQSHGGTVSEAAVLARCHAGLAQGDSGLSAPEAQWVTQRLAELLEWPIPEFPAEEA